MYILLKPVHAYSHRCCYMSPTVYALDFRGMLNKLANLEATLVRNSDRPTDGSKVSVWNWTILHILDCTLDITCHNAMFYVSLSTYCCSSQTVACTAQKNTLGSLQCVDHSNVLVAYLKQFWHGYIQGKNHPVYCTCCIHLSCSLGSAVYRLCRSFKCLPTVNLSCCFASSNSSMDLKGSQPWMRKLAKSYCIYQNSKKGCISKQEKSCDKWKLHHGVEPRLDREKKEQKVANCVAQDKICTNLQISTFSNRSRSLSSWRSWREIAGDKTLLSPNGISFPNSFLWGLGNLT